MSSTNVAFSKQQELASKKRSNLEDPEKIYLMKKEIDNLKTMLRVKNNGSLTTKKPSTTAAATNTISSQTGSSSSSSTLDRAPVLTLFLFVGVLLVTMFRRKQRQGWNFGGSRRTPLPLQDGEMTFELQEAPDYEFQASPAVQASASIQFL
jgi:hypothetical protein